MLAKRQQIPMHIFSNGSDALKGIAGGFHTFWVVHTEYDGYKPADEL
jgi:hypothetical protein